jgi:radical SAM protein with 4Fe4S-binding SPASM domain
MPDRPEHPDPDSTLPPPAEDSIRGLFEAGDLEVFDRRLGELASPDPDRWQGLAFPIELALELANVCNLRCVMCPVPTTSRKPKLMDDEVFRSAVDEASRERGFVFLPQGFGESMLHPRWAELVALAVERGIRPVVMLTNAMKLDDANIESMLSLPVDALIVSIDGVDPETYARLRVGGDLRTVEANVRRLVERRGDRPRPRICVRIIRMEETRDEIDAFYERWTGWLRADDEIRVNEFNDWAGKVEDRGVAQGTEEPAERGPCRMLWRNLSVHADGKVSACCHDSEDELIVGDLAAGESLRDIWEGERLARLRRIHREGSFEQLPICERCRNWS